MSPIEILLCDQMHAEAQARLMGRQDFALKLSRTVHPDPIELETCQVLLIRSRTKVDGHLLEQAPRLRLIVTMTAGFDHIDLKATEDRGVVVMHTPHAHIASAAELTWLLILGLHRGLIEADQNVRGGAWRKDLVRGRNLEGRTLGLIGLGRVGSRVAQMAKAFGVNVMAFDPYVGDEVFVAAGVEKLGFHELLRVSDIVSLHVPKTAETYHMIREATLKWMSPGAMLVNTSRGSVCQWTDLLKALKDGILSGLGLDVYENEPFHPSEELRKLKQVIFTPHLGAHTEQAWEMASHEAAKKLFEFFDESEVSDALPPNALWYTEPAFRA